MQENEFEKRVQQKMDELKIAPSDAVWQKIEPQIRKEKRRRWLLIFLPVMFIGLLYGGYVLLNSNDPDTKRHQQVTKNLQQDITAPATKTTKTIIDSTNYNQSLKDNEEKTIAQTPGTRNNRTQKLKARNKLKNNTDQDMSINQEYNSSLKKPGFDSTKSIAENYKSNTDKDPEQKVSVPVESIPAITQANEPAKQNDSDSAKTNSEIKNEKTDQDIVTPPEKKNPTKNKNPWNWGLTFSAGASGMANSLLGGIFGDGQKSADLLYSSATGSSFPGLTARPSLIRSSYAFITGLASEKKISKKTIFTAGLNYKLFSTTNAVGADSAAFFSAYNDVNRYHSYYHYIELPVGLKFQVADLKKTKLFVNTGFSISQFISTNALQFNNTTRLYYHDNSLFNKTLIGFNAGLDMAIPANQRSFLIGPYFNYGLTKIAKEGYNKHHFIFIGLRAQYFFRKK